MQRVMVWPLQTPKGEQSNLGLATSDPQGEPRLFGFGHLGEAPTLVADTVLRRQAARGEQANLGVNKSGA